MLVWELRKMPPAPALLVMFRVGLPLATETVLVAPRVTMPVVLAMSIVPPLDPRATLRPRVRVPARVDWRVPPLRVGLPAPSAVSIDTLTVPALMVSPPKLLAEL